MLSSCGFNVQLRFRRRSGPRLALMLALVCAGPAVCQGQAGAEDDDEFVPGLTARYTVAGQTLDRIDRDIHFDWGKQSPDARLPAGPLSVHWQGRLLARGSDPHAFHLFLCGTATVRLNDRVVVSGTRDTPSWVAGELVDLGEGEPRIEITYQQTGDSALIRLFWSSPKFPTEPVPPQALFRSTPRRELDQVARGAELFATLRCQACHRDSADEVPAPAPALAKHGVEVDRNWLVDWLVSPTRHAGQSRMPALGFSQAEAAAIADYLVKPAAAEPADRWPAGAERSAAVRQGEILFRSLGCLACHTRGTEGSAAPHGGGDLTAIGSKRSIHWLDRWLADPGLLNRDHRMPVFSLSDEERQSLALFLGSLQITRDVGPETSPATVDVSQLLAAARCAACHRLDDQQPGSLEPRLSALRQPVRQWERACSEVEQSVRLHQPVFRLNKVDQQALRDFVASRALGRSVISQTVRGEHLLLSKGCLQCHDRDAGRGLSTLAASIARSDEALVGQSESLVPPNLTAVGDKLRDEALITALSGTAKTRRLPWLRVRMPRFQHTPEEAEALRAYLVAHDRIPPAAPQAAPAERVLQSADNDAKTRSAWKTAGQLLAGTRGFSCTACHKIASYEPRNVALATRGSDLYLIGQRMRPEYFLRWTRSPLRVIPGMEMPSFERPVAGVLAGELDQQLAALWVGLNDRSGPPKLDTSTIEQVLTVSPGERPRIVRDVFNVGSPQGPRFVPRALAIGFENSLHLLFNLDVMALQGIWSGDFARQRASGKSWFWEPAGTQAQFADNKTPDLVLRPTTQPAAGDIVALKESGRYGRLLSYQHVTTAAESATGHPTYSIRLQYALTFDLPSGPAQVLVEERYTPVAEPADAGHSACRRSLTVRSIPAGYTALLRASASNTTPSIRLEPGRMPDEARGDFDLQIPVQKPPNSETPGSPPRSHPPDATRPEAVTAVPGFDGIRLPVPLTIMPTAITWTADGTLAFCSLKGQIYLAHDTDGDGVEDRLTVFEEGLAAPYGLIADGKDLIVSHKPELLRLRDTDGDGRADVREVLADGWGYTDDYHDWTTGIVRDSRGALYIGTGSDYAKPGRDPEKSRWRGKVLRVDPDGKTTPLGHAFRYPTGLAITADDQVFVSDNQGVQNTFNEINHLVDGASYGVPSLFEEQRDAPATLPAIQVPHPWTRSINGLFFLPGTLGGESHPFARHGLGCEYDSRFLVRFTVQRVGSTYQGAVYPFSVPQPAGARHGFLGMLCGAVSPRGDIYVGGIYDSGWLGGPNIGELVRLRPNHKLPLGIRDIQAGPRTFRMTFTAPVAKAAASKPANYEIWGYTRKWQGSYATPDSGRHQLTIESAEVAADGLSVTLHTPLQQTGFVYDITCGKIGPDPDTPLWPTVGHYTLNALPEP
ncbi:MAG: c-type cytochrome [Planctomycetes bacterium]|nr:c-type cytochrome [Planctomycetota bacterium]